MAAVGVPTVRLRHRFSGSKPEFSKIPRPNQRIFLQRPNAAWNFWRHVSKRYGPPRPASRPSGLINRLFLPLRVAGGWGVKQNRHEVRFGGTVRPPWGPLDGIEAVSAIAARGRSPGGGRRGSAFFASPFKGGLIWIVLGAEGRARNRWTLKILEKLKNVRVLRLWKTA